MPLDLVTNGDTAAALRTKINAVINQVNDADIAALAALSTTGHVVRTGAGTYSCRTITGTANELTVANGDGVAGNPTLSLPAALTFTGKTVTNGSFTGPTISGGTIAAVTNLGIRSTGSGAFDLTFANTENLTSGRALTIKVNDAARTIDIAGNITTAAAFITSGANSLTLTTTGGTNVTLPTTGTLATLAGAEAFTNKTGLNGHTIPGGASTLALLSDFGILRVTIPAAGAYTLVAADKNSLVYVKNAGAVALNLPVVGTLAVGAFCIVHNDPTSTNDFTITPTGGDTLEGTAALVAGDSAILIRKATTVWLRLKLA